MTGGSQFLTEPKKQERRDLNESIVISPNDLNDFYRPIVNNISHMSRPYKTSRVDLNAGFVGAPPIQIG